jgi:hypothetical protein
MNAQQGFRLPVYGGRRPEGPAARRNARAPRLVAGVLAGGLAVLGLAGCDGNSVSLASDSATALHEKVAAVRAAADNHDRDGAVAAIDAFRAEVAQLRDAGQLDRAAAAALLAHADAIAADVLASVEPLPTPSPSPTATPTPTPVATMTPDNIETLRQETADKLTEMLRERLAAYVQQRMAEQKAQDKAVEATKRAAHKKDRKGGSR